jgi:acylphosphatase
MIARRFIVRGRVQGVGFRYFAIHSARRAGVVGLVRNLTDGSVEAVAEGEAESVARFRECLERGPTLARVIEVVEIELPVSGGYTDFDVSF